MLASWGDPFRNHKGQVEWEDYEGWEGYPTPHYAEDAEFRAPKDSTFRLPEGCCWATDFVVGQRVRFKGHHEDIFKGHYEDILSEGTVEEVFPRGTARVKWGDQGAGWLEYAFGELEGY